MSLIEDLLEKKILILDGAMGTQIQHRNLSEDDFRGNLFCNHTCTLQGNNDVLSLTQPEIIKDIHLQYLEAGADIISTNTFNATSISQKHYSLKFFIKEMNRAAAILAKQAASTFTTADKPRFVAGSIGPTNVMMSLTQDVMDPGKREVDFDTLVESYQQQIAGLVEGGVDLLLIETIFDTLTGKAAVYAAKDYFKKIHTEYPLMIAGTIVDQSGRTLSGQNLQAFSVSMAHANPLSIGLNCSLGPKGLERHIKNFKEVPFFTSVHPNAGLPNDLGEYDQEPHEFVESIKPFFEQNLLNIVGGCCGTTPDYIAKLSDLAKEYTPRKRSKIKQKTQFSGLEVIVFHDEINLVNVGERTSVAGSRRFLRLIQQGNYAAALEIARKQVESGAQILDINVDASMLDSPREMRTFLRYLSGEPDIARIPFMIDSSDWSVLEEGLKNVQGKAIVNSISLKDGEELFLDRARKIMNYGAGVVVMAFDEQGQADTYDRRIGICQRAYRLLRNIDFPVENIIFDPNIFPVATGLEEHATYALDFFNATNWIKENLPGALVSGGLSNVSFAFRGNDSVRRAMHSVFLFHAVQYGLDMAIMNPQSLRVYDDIDPTLKTAIEDVYFNRSKDATANLVELARNQPVESIISQEEASWRKLPLDERISYSLLNGLDEFIIDDIKEAYDESGDALQIIEGPLMNAMTAVGDLFGSGKMFLPQVVKSARVMKTVTQYLKPYITRDSTDRGTVVLATVKGDVHDIGKNIVSIVLGCSGYRVIDLGVQVPVEKILSAIEEHDADVVGLSGLITPSLEEMISIAKELEIKEHTIPLLVGGATTSVGHTAMKIAPEYSSGVIHVADASKAPVVVGKLLSASDKEAFLDKTKATYDLKRAKLCEKRFSLVSLDEARNKRPKLDFSENNLMQPNWLGRNSIDYSVEDLRTYINWTSFFMALGLKGIFPVIMEQGGVAVIASNLYSEANSLLDRMVQESWTKLHANFGFWPANSVIDDIYIYRDVERQKILATVPTLRQQRKGSKYNALADFIAPIGFADHIGAFVVTTGQEIKERVALSKEQGLVDQAIIISVLADRLAEACAEYLHYKVRQEYWGYSPEEKLDDGAFMKRSYRGIRPAPGYNACPDNTGKRIIFDLLEPSHASLIENVTMDPPATISGWFFAHPEARYFGLGKIGSDQVQDYARRMNVSLNAVKRQISKNIISP